MGEIEEGWEIRGTSESVREERGGGKRGRTSRGATWGRYIFLGGSLSSSSSSSSRGKREGDQARVSFFSQEEGRNLG